MSKLTKNQKAVAEKVEAGKAYTLAEAMSLVKEITTSAWVLTPVRPTRWFVALFLSLTEQEK